MFRFVKMVILSLVFSAIWSFFAFIFEKTFPFLTLSILGIMLFTIPMIVVGVSGFRWGTISGLIWSLGQVLLLDKSSEFLFLSIIIYPLTTGIASRKLEDKASAPWHLLLAIGIQIGFRLVVA